MSTSTLAQNTLLRSDGTTVMVKEFRGRPRIVQYLGEHQGAAIVTGTDENAAIGFHFCDVYEYDVEMHDALIDAFESGRTADISGLWRRAKKFRPGICG